jgi:hypothetical protein
MFQVPTFLLLCCSSDLSGEPEIKSWSAIFRTHKISKGMDQKPNPLPSELRHPGLVVFLKARKRVLDLPFSSSSSVSAAADVSKKDVQLREKCIEICAIYLMAKNHILFLPFVLQLDLKLHLECERLKATERAP